MSEPRQRPAGSEGAGGSTRAARRSRRRAQEPVPEATAESTPRRSAAPAPAPGPKPESLQKLERAARHRAEGGRLVSPDARKALCEACGSPDVAWGALCDRCRGRLAGRRPGADGTRAVEGAPAPTGRKETSRPRRTRSREDELDRIAPVEPTRTIIHAHGQGTRPAAGRPAVIPAAPAAAPPSVDSLLAGLPGAVYRSAALPGRPLIVVKGRVGDILGREAGALAGYALDAWLHPEDRATTSAAIAALPAGSPFSLEYRMVRPDGTEIWVQDRGRATSEAGRLWIDGVLVDVTAERRVRAELARMALHDPLTDLPNRRALMARATREVDEAQTTGAPLSLVILDVDHFKRINDTLGHAAGDRALIEMSQALRRRVPHDGLLARFGGEEFALLAPGVTREDLRIVAETLRRASDAVIVNGLGPVTMSAGAATLGPGEDAEGLLVRADRALYRAKAAGRSRLVLD